MVLDRSLNVTLPRPTHIQPCSLSTDEFQLPDTSRSALISYSWDSDTHKTWVRELAARLVTNGVDTKLDDWHVKPGESLTQFMELNIQICDHVLIICTPNYAKKSVERKGGVGYEQQIISGNIAAGADRKKFIPVIRSGDFAVGDNCALPPHFLGMRAIDMRSSKNDSQSFEALLRAIYDEPEFAPPLLGAKPDFGTLVGMAKRPLRLATVELDGWRLTSGVASNERAPDTFHIPPEDERQKVDSGDLVKLMFEMSFDKDDSDLEIERMWVAVSGANGPYLTGILENEPVASAEEDPLHYGSEVIFLPEHIINIIKRDELDFIAEVRKIDDEMADSLWRIGVKREDREKFLELMRDFFVDK